MRIVPASEAVRVPHLGTGPAELPACERKDLKQAGGK